LRGYGKQCQWTFSTYEKYTHMYIQEIQCYLHVSFDPINICFDNISTMLDVGNDYIGLCYLLDGILASYMVYCV